MGHLVLKRRVDEEIVIIVDGEEILLKILAISKGRGVSIGIIAPERIKIERGEKWQNPPESHE